MKNKIVLGVIAFIFLIFFFKSYYIVDETQQVIITRFGKPIGEPINTPGLKFKVPLLEEANYFDKRFLEWDGDPNQVPTKDKRFIWVDTYARWRITDPLLFFQRLRDERGAQSRLDDIIDGETRNAIANNDVVELVRSTNRIAQLDSGMMGIEEQVILTIIREGRDKITREILTAASERTKDLGLEILDVRLKRINYVEEVQEKIYDRMIAERKRIAERFRSEGQGDASAILGEKERELKRITSEAFEKSQVIIGRADGEATKIYAGAYNRSDESRDFYRFLKTMEIYETTFNKDDWLILSSNSDFYKFLKSRSGK
jgi:membrane protease subunit HflC